MEERLAGLWTPGLPKVLRGVPRLYKRENPEISKIKPAFDDFEINKRRYFEKLFLQDYAHKTIPKNAHLILFTWVLEDGWGDYYTQQRAAEVLQEVFPTLRITLISLIHKNRTLPKENNVFERFVFFYTGKTRSELIYEEFSEAVLALLKNADVMIQLPTYFPHTEKVLKHCGGKTQYELIGECGFIDSAWFHPKTQAHCMGLHFLEKGLLFKKINAQPTGESIHVDYTKTKRGHFLYLNTLLKALENDSRDCIIVTSSLQFVIEEMETKLKLLCSRFGVSEIIIHFQKKICRVPITKKGKKLLLHYFEHLPQQDFLNYVAKTDLLIGCTGDGSFADAIATGKPFFYDPPEHKRTFFKDLIALAEDRLQEYPETITFLKLSLINPHLVLGPVQDGWVSEEFLNREHEIFSCEDNSDDWLAEKMGSLLQLPRTRLGFKELSRIILSEYSMNDTLRYLVLRALQ